MGLLGLGHVGSPEGYGRRSPSRLGEVAGWEECVSRWCCGDSVRESGTLERRFTCGRVR
ncbi:hypothetical protein BOO71_0012403 [Deinococcus marmoris]|uniref:Uncharacterized protein n=1 Tax=Deinococcus marmoris TaxID=249408 RepID=A0A1U7NTN1_9DEIO|nr:hypothetical protein BOO71_0012403 [Deinococcus marmoris]